MKLSDNLMSDVSFFLSKVDELTHTARKELLVTILTKNLITTEGDLLLSKYDFDMMVSSAKSNMANSSLATSISGKEIDQKEAVNLMFIEGVVSVLNSRGALKRLPKFDRR